MHCSLHIRRLICVAALSGTAAARAETVPEPVSVTDIPPSNAAELHAHSEAEAAFRQAAGRADAAMKKARAEGGEWREAADLLMRSSMASRTGDLQAAIGLARQARRVAEESYRAVVAARRAAAERAAAEVRQAAGRSQSAQ